MSGITRGWIAKNNYLDYTAMQNNATIVYSFLKPLGWSTEAICALLGNMQAESTINPQLYEGRRLPEVGASSIPWGYGLVQWTPATKFIWWADEQGLNYLDGYAQLARIEYERQTWKDRYKGLSIGLQWICPCVRTDEEGKKYCCYTMYDWSTSTDDVYQLAYDFMAYYERPAKDNSQTRGQYAEYWYRFFKGESGGTSVPVPPAGLPNWVIYSPEDDTQHRLPVWQLLKPRRR